jgi:hypothetical protein
VSAVNKLLAGSKTARAESSSMPFDCAVSSTGATS